MPRKKVAVVYGGRSVEHDVSIVTAHQVMAALEPRHDVVPVYVTKEGKWLTSSALNDLDVYRAGRWDDVGEEAFFPPTAGYAGLLVPGGRLRGPRRIPVDVVVPAIHGTYGEDGTLQGLLELADLPYVGSPLTGSAVGMDKPAMKACFRTAGLPVVDDLLVETAHLDADEARVVNEIEARIGYPAFVKPSRLGSSVGIGKATDRESLKNALDVARRYDTRILVEKAMEGCIEINCSVIGGFSREPRASVCEQPLGAEGFLSFSDKYLGGAKAAAESPSAAAGVKSGGMATGQKRRIPAPLSEELTKQVQENAVAAFESVAAAGVARVDSFVREDTGETWVMEINTVPGSFSFYLWEASGLNFPGLMDELIEIAEEGHRIRSDLMFTFDSGILQQPRGGKAGG